jgi:hypothetical protein
MDFVLDLSNLKTDRYFIFGDICGNYELLIDALYEQNFNKNDTLIATGNIIDENIDLSLECLYFIMNNHNTYSVKGKNEFNLINKNINNTPQWFKTAENQYAIKQYLEELPLVIKATNKIYIVNSGAEPNKKLEEQSPDVFYNIGDYDKDSRFYLFDNPDKKSWYEFEFKSGDTAIKFCFGGKFTRSNDLPAGYSLGQDEKRANLKYLIIDKMNQDTPILIET